MQTFIDAWKAVPGMLKQFAIDCWYAPMWLKLTNSIWLVILVSLFWFSVSWFVEFVEVADPEPKSLESGLLGMFVMLFPLIFTFVLFGLRTAYEWIATKILVRFGFIEKSK